MQRRESERAWAKLRWWFRGATKNASQLGWHSSKGLYSLGSGLAPEAHVVVQVKEVGPGLNIFPGLTEVGQHFAEIASRFGIAVRSAALHVLAPGFDLP